MAENKKRSWFDRLFRRKSVEPVEDFELVETSLTESVEDDELEAEIQAYLASERAKDEVELEAYLSQQKELAWQEYEKENPPPTVVSANNLPDGWNWTHYNDGSGSLMSSANQKYFSYDRQSYAMQDGIEYKKDDKSGYTVFWGSFDEFVAFAEDTISKERCFLDKHDIRGIMHTVSMNAWYAQEPTTVEFTVNNNVVKIDGYVYEPSYESFSATSSISLNGEVLFGEDSRNVDAYKNEVYQLGAFSSIEDAVSHIRDKVYGLSNIDNVISNATAVSEQQKDDNKSLHNKAIEEFNK